MTLCLLCVSPSWGWVRGRFGFRGGPRVVVGVGPWWPYGYPDYSYPYYGYYYAPYAPAYAYETYETAAAARPLTKEELRFKYDDGDITKEEYEAGLRQLAETKAQPRAEDKSRGEPLTAVNDLQMELRVLLDQKLKEGSITRAQHDAEVQYLGQIDRQAHSEAQANGGRLAPYDESALVRKLHQAYYAINHNLVVNP
jgi:hypothetical protein